MVRVNSAIPKRKRHKRILKRAKGQFGKRSKNFRQALKSLVRGMVYEYRDRKVRKREFRSLWITRISAACREEGISYSRFIDGLGKAKIHLNRKVIADLAIHELQAFKKLVEAAKGK